MDFCNLVHEKKIWFCDILKIGNKVKDKLKLFCYLIGWMVTLSMSSFYSEKNSEMNLSSLSELANNYHTTITKENIQIPYCEFALSSSCTSQNKICTM